MNQHSHLTDEELVQQIRDGDERAFRLLVEKYRKMGLSLAYNMTGSIEDAEDISQEAFAIIYTEIAKFRGESSFRTWFYKIVLNLCRRYHRKKRIASIISLNFLNKEGETEEMDIPVEFTPEQELSNKQLGRSIYSAIKRLPARQREIFIMKHITGLKINEIAEITGSAEGTVKAHLFRAIKELQKHLRDFL